MCSHERSEVRDVLVKREKIRGWKLVHRKRVRICLSLGFQESNTKDSYSECVVCSSGKSLHAVRTVKTLVTWSKCGGRTSKCITFNYILNSFDCADLCVCVCVCVCVKSSHLYLYSALTITNCNKHCKYQK